MHDYVYITLYFYTIFIANCIHISKYKNLILFSLKIMPSSLFRYSDYNRILKSLLRKGVSNWLICLEN